MNLYQLVLPLSPAPIAIRRLVVSTNAVYAVVYGEPRKRPTFDLVVHLLASDIADESLLATDGGTLASVTILTKYFEITMTQALVRREHLYRGIKSAHDGKAYDVRMAFVAEEAESVVQLRIIGGNAETQLLVPANSSSPIADSAWITGVGTFRPDYSAVRSLDNYGSEELSLLLSHDDTQVGEHLLGAAVSGEPLDAVQMPTDRDRDLRRSVYVVQYDFRFDELETSGRVTLGPEGYGNHVSLLRRHLCFTGRETVPRPSWDYDWLPGAIRQIGAVGEQLDPQLRLDLRPPASENDIASAEAALGVVFPPSLRSFYQQHDGMTLTTRKHGEERVPNVIEMAFDTLDFRRDLVNVYDELVVDSDLLRVVDYGANSCMLDYSLTTGNGECVLVSATHEAGPSYWRTHVDYASFGAWLRHVFDRVVFDPDYRLHG